MEGMDVEKDGVSSKAVSSDGSLPRPGHWSRAVEEDEESDVERDSGWPRGHTSGVSSGQLCSSGAVEQGLVCDSVCRTVPAEDQWEGDKAVRRYFHQQLERTAGSAAHLLTGTGRSTLPVSTSESASSTPELHVAAQHHPVRQVAGSSHRIGNTSYLMRDRFLEPVSWHSTRESALSQPELTPHHPLRLIASSPSDSELTPHHPLRHVEDILNKVPEYSSLNPELRLRLVDSQRHPEVSDHPDPQSRTDIRRYDVRLNTFHRRPHKWPLEQPSAQRLARVGFTYKGMEDTVVCHNCGLELSDWAEPGTPEPLLRHYTANPACTFILQAYQDQLPSLRAQQDSQRSKYANTSARLHSFSSWPFSDIVTSYQLASVGFYYAGEGAKVICFSCGIIISEWKRGDVPLLVHRNRSPHCQFLTSIITKGSPSPSPSQQPLPRLRLLEATGSSGAASRPDWSNPQTRLKSFKKLSPAFPVAREDLAEAGLYLLRLPDVMKCFSCSAVVDQWTEGDTAVEKHRQVSPHCEFLKQTHPSKLDQEQSPSELTFDPSSLPAPSFDQQTLEQMAQEVRRVEPLSPPAYRPEAAMAALSLHDDSTLPSSISYHPSLPGSATTYLSLPSSLSTRHHLPASQSTSSSSLFTHPSPSSSHPSLPTPTSPRHHYPHSTESQPLSLSATLSPSPHLPRHREGPVSPSPSSGPELFSSAEIMGKSVSLPPSYHSRPPPLQDAPITYPMGEQPSSLPAGAECVVCMDKPPEMVLVPCGHICVCESCSTQIARCPICRTRTQMSVKVYYPY